eukprot:8472713-Lingulodinium_polyedra.AAC.1
MNVRAGGNVLEIVTDKMAATGTRGVRHPRGPRVARAGLLEDFPTVSAPLADPRSYGKSLTRGAPRRPRGSAPLASYGLNAGRPPHGPRYPRPLLRATRPDSINAALRLVHIHLHHLLV